VGEEDAGYALIHYLENFMKLYKSNTGQSSVPLYMHSSETSWPDDLIASNLADDPVSTIDNSYEVLLLGTRRIGHGAALIKHPYLLEVIRQMNIAVEICMVSNQILGFNADLRNHQGLHFYRSGIPIVLSPDDPGTFGYDNLTVDWYEAFMGWGLSLADLKAIAINSLNYSAMTATEKTEAMNRWQILWNDYIGSKKTEACNRDYRSDGANEGRTPSFARLLPREGSREPGTRVHIFGKNFERAICKENLLRCRFGSLESQEAVYISNEHIICVTPDAGVSGSSQLSVDVSVTLDGTNYIDTNLAFTYPYDQFTTAITPVHRWPPAWGLGNNADPDSKVQKVSHGHGHGHGPPNF